ncbi:tRNA lysidine(34) synthetase TilS [Paracoccus aestuariivivens]|uniref:tRNA(Ile)-lysidine synthase n=1 Tax=Paracoccus aestuariivivens TaxID=1820333 RepID=A0A6L6J6E7_9RHOB|nr:tRNA lysidine(34) synthetase TilS [Paracoccus aestuariivivens]MTH77693.1 tRNA lysidine(34) synthetase TilS [Paracoccus aestuariivivens]
MASDPDLSRIRTPTTQDPVFAKSGAALNRLAGDLPRIGIALSGGGDSTALMHLAHAWAQGRVLMAATVDHGLRAESAEEARQAHRAASALGIPHATLLWQRDNDAGNLMAEARDARLRLLSGWAMRNNLDAVLLGHTMDDQAETLLMRLARGSGVDGLAGMADSRSAFGTRWLRPILGVSRAELRDWLTARGIAWIDDPSNENADYDRVRIRKALQVLDLPALQLAQTSANMAMARDALQDFAMQVATGAKAQNGVLRLPLTAFRRAPQEIRRRLLVAGLRFVTGGDYPPRREAVLHVLNALNTAPRITLDGVIAEPRGDWLLLQREPAAAAKAMPVAPEAGDDALWDGRWRLEGLVAGNEVRALGYEPLPALNWRASGLTRDEAAASPGVWMDGALIAAPLLTTHAKIAAVPLRGLPEFQALLYTH